MLKYHLNLVRIWYQNPSIFHPNSRQKTPRKPASFFVTILVSKIIQNLMKTPSKMLDRNCASPPWATLARSNRVLGLKDTFKGPQAAHFGVIWTSFGPNFQAVQPVLTSFLGQLSFAKYNSQFV